MLTVCLHPPRHFFLWIYVACISLPNGITWQYNFLTWKPFSNISWLPSMSINVLSQHCILIDFTLKSINLGKCIFHSVRKMIFSIKMFVPLLDYLKILQVTILGDCIFKGSLLLLPDSCMTPLLAKLYALTHLPSLLANWGRFVQDMTWTNPGLGAGTTVSGI
jgi:hypothetical protein